VVLISGRSIAMAGARTGIVIPQGAEEIDGAGKFMIPGIVNLYGSKMDGPVSVLARMRTPGGQARAGDAGILFDSGTASVEEQALEQARKDKLPAFARIATMADARRLVAAGVTGFIGMIRDTEAIEPAFIARMRDLRIVWAPVLSGLSGPELEIAKRNTRRLAEGRVLIALGSGPAPVRRELELLQEAGLPPGEVIVAATRNGAMALGKSNEFGTIQAGRRADLVMVARNPMEDVRDLKPERVMVDGAWR
jgi:imidazolonepropionase-like amidohydrolase